MKKQNLLRKLANSIEKAIITKDFSILEVPVLDFPKFSPNVLKGDEMDRIITLSGKLMNRKSSGSNNPIQEIIDKDFLMILIELLDWSNLSFLQYKAAKLIKFWAQSGEFQKILIDDVVVSLLNVSRISTFDKIKLQVFVFFVYLSFFFHFVRKWFSKTEQIHDLFPLLVDIIHEGNFLKNVKTALKGIIRILRNCSNICRKSIRKYLINNNAVKKILPSFQYSTKIIT